MKPSKANVVIAIATNGSNGREEMSGVFEYVNRHTNWAVHIVNTRTDIANGILQDTLRNANGLILGTAHGITWLADKFVDPKLKTVVIQDHLAPLFANHPNCRTLLVDSVSVGKDAALYFNSLGRFASYGFVHGAIHYPWSLDRERGFRSALPHKMPLFVFPDDETTAKAKVPPNAATPAIAVDALGKWLEALPKPAAVFGANDLFATEVLTVCAQIGIKVPQQVSVVGCDNDMLVWGSVQPPLSSFQLPFHELGYRAAQTLDRLLQNRKTSQRTIRIGGTRLFERGSTAHIPPATALVENARTYIAEHACEGIRATDVVAHVGVSRSLLDLRFRQVCGKSVLEEILDVRLAEVRRQLKETDNTILQIGRDCGFRDMRNFKRLFKSRFGMSMRDWRNSVSGGKGRSPTT